jgi:hypothetical protein
MLSSLKSRDLRMIRGKCKEESEKSKGESGKTEKRE